MNLKETVMKSPSYLYSLLGTSEDILLVYNFKENDKSFIATPQKKSMDYNTSLDITGSPLKVDLDNSSFINLNIINDCNNFWQQQEESHSPIPYKDALKYIQSYWSKNHNSLNSLPVWCVCDGEDEQGIVLVSAIQTPSYISRCLITRNGFLPKNHHSITFEAMCNKHFDSIREFTGEKQKVPLRQLTTDISTIYELFGSKITQTNFDNMNIPGSVYLEVKWNLCCADIPLDNSKSVLTIQTIVGQDSSVMYRFWKELILLELFIKTLADYGSKKKIVHSCWLPGKFNVNKIFDFNEEIIETINNCYKQRYNAEKDAKNLLQIVENIDNRHTYDITDRLWNILSKCSNYGSLKDCLNVVYTEIAQCENEIFIADTNYSIMAQMIRDIVARKLPMFVLTGTQPIEILIDIGLEKLRKDFLFIYKEFDICTEQELDEIFNQLFRKANSADLSSSINDISRSNIRTSLYNKKSFTSCEYLEDRIKVLGQMHTAIETLILVPTQWQAVSVKYIYEHFVVNGNDVFDSFATLAQKKMFEILIKLPVSEIYEYIRKFNPVMWRLSLTFSRPIYSVQSVFHLSQRPIFPPRIYPHDMMDATSMHDANEIYYHFTHLTNVKNFIKTKLV